MGSASKARNRLAAAILKVLLGLRRGLNRLIRLTLSTVADSSAVLKHIEISDVSGRLTARMEKIAPLVPVSFIDLMNQRTKKKKLASTRLPEWRLNDKLIGAELSQACGYRVPKIYHQDVAAGDIAWRNNSIIKPREGFSSIGVYAYYSQNRIFDVANDTYLKTRVDLTKNLKEHTRLYDQDSWMVEEMITDTDGQLARDLKFYSFYGEIGLVLEVRKVPDKKYCFWDEQGSRIDTGKHPKGSLFRGKGFGQAHLDAAKRLSLEVPAPFVRIDFLDDGEELVFGEFTPRPGGFGLINRRTDAMLGEKFVAAETRLFNDLLDGKKFSSYERAVTDV